MSPTLVLQCLLLHEPRAPGGIVWELSSGLAVPDTKQMFSEYLEFIHVTSIY